MVPAAKAVTPIDEDKQTHNHDLERERLLLFVARTCAREKQRMVNIYRLALSEGGYNATYFRSMLAQFGPLETAHKLLAAAAVSDGFAALWERGRLDLTVETVVIDTQFAELFSDDEIQVAHWRLEQFGHHP